MTWQVGDLAVCVDARPGRWGQSGLIEGHTYTVIDVLVRRIPIPSGVGLSHCGLLFAEVSPTSPNDVAFASQRFRKILPDKHEDCEPEFVELLNRVKRKVEA